MPIALNHFFFFFSGISRNLNKPLIVSMEKTALSAAWIVGTCKLKLVQNVVASDAYFTAKRKCEF